MTVEEFIAKWEGTPGGEEKKNFPLFIDQLCKVLGVDPPSEPDCRSIEFVAKSPSPGFGLDSI